MSNLFLRSGKKIKQKRTSLGLSQEALATIAGISTTYLGEIERGRVQVSTATLSKINYGLNANSQSYLNCLKNQGRIKLDALKLLNIHYESFYRVSPFANKTGHPVPVDTRAWSQILASILSRIQGIKRKKGADLDDGSDVKGANTWQTISTARFNNVITAGTKSTASGAIKLLNKTPYFFLVLWDHRKEIRKKTERPRCRVWCIRPQYDKLFRKLCASWYKAWEKGKLSKAKGKGNKSNAKKKKIIIFDNFQLHPPRDKNTNIITNDRGNFKYPLLFCAEYYKNKSRYNLVKYNPIVLKNGKLRRI